MAEDSLRLAQKLIERIPKSVLWTFAGVGLLALLQRVVPPLQAYCNYYLYWTPDYVRRYGKGTYVLITGASDGIGEVLAYEFAKMGFNLVLVGRNECKLTRVREKCELSWKAVVHVIIEDLATTDICVFERIACQVADFDISILVNNAGMIVSGSFEEMAVQDFCSMISLNCLSHTVLTKCLLPKLLSRPRRSLIISTASIAGVVPVGFAAVYSASKAYIRMLFLSLQQEVKDKIDVYVANPSRVRTKMLGDVQDLPAVISIEKAVQGLLRDACRTRESFCSFLHFWRFFSHSTLSTSEQTALFSAAMHRQVQAMRNTKGNA